MVRKDWLDDSGNPPPTAGDVNCLLRPADIARAAYPELYDPPLNDNQAAIRALGVAFARVAKIIEDATPFTPEGLQNAEICREARGIVKSYLAHLELIAIDNEQEQPQ